MCVSITSALQNFYYSLFSVGRNPTKSFLGQLVCFEILFAPDFWWERQALSFLFFLSKPPPSTDRHTPCQPLEEASCRRLIGHKSTRREREGGNLAATKTKLIPKKKIVVPAPDKKGGGWSPHTGLLYSFLFWCLKKHQNT